MGWGWLCWDLREQGTGRAVKVVRAWHFSYSFDTIEGMAETTYSIGEGPATRVSLSLPEGTAEAIRARVGKREFSAFIAEAVERELRGQVLDEYLADYESRKGPVSEPARQRARQVFDEVFAEEAEWPAAG